MDQRTFAERIGVHPISVSKYATGRTVPRADVASRIVEVTSGAVTPTDLVQAYQAKQAQRRIAPLALA